MNKDQIGFQHMVSDPKVKELSKEEKLSVPERIRLHIRDS